jgi:hypothetical protein
MQGWNVGVAHGRTSSSSVSKHLLGGVDNVLGRGLSISALPALLCRRDFRAAALDCASVSISRIDLACWHPKRDQVASRAGV